MRGRRRYLEKNYNYSSVDYDIVRDPKKSSMQLYQTSSECFFKKGTANAGEKDLK
jgi:hypothetical protein